MHSPAAFYDALAPYYDLIFEDWDKSIARQAAVLDAIIRTHRPQGAHSVLDVACGIGTQALGSRGRGHLPDRHARLQGHRFRHRPGRAQARRGRSLEARPSHRLLSGGHESGT